MLLGVLAVLLVGIVVAVVVLVRPRGTGRAPAARDVAPEYVVPGHCTVVLGDAGPRPRETLEAVRETTGVDARQARDWVGATPCAIAGGLSRESADAVLARLGVAGASAWVEG